MPAEGRDPTLRPRRPANQRWEEPVSEAKPFDIPKQLVWDAYQRVKANRGAAGVDGVSLAAFETDLKGNLYKVWNRMASGSYHPPPVRLVEIPKATGGTRPLGISTVSDRVAQTVVTMVLTRIVYCKDDDRPGQHEHIAFDFLGYTFQPRRAKNRWGRYFVSFLPAISTKAATAIRQTVRGWRMASTRNNQCLEDLARLVNPVVRGWLNYYGRFYRSRCVQVLRSFNEALGKWAQRKYTRFRRQERAAMHWLGRIARRDPNLFVLWQQGVRPEAGV